MLGSRRVRNLILHFPQRQQPDYPLGTGVHRVVREASGHVGVGDHVQGALLAQLCVDRRGLWLQVASGMRGLHVNGRAVHRVAQLRAGDALFADGVELRVRADVTAAPVGPGRRSMDVADPRIVLRGVGGRYHGRSIGLERPITVGGEPASDIRLELPGSAAAHAILERQGDRVLLRDAGSADGSLVNGVRIREALLEAGDQVVFEPQARFVVEVPWGKAVENDLPPEVEPGFSADLPAAAPVSVGRWPWLLLAALLIAGALAALLLFGAG